MRRYGILEEPMGEINAWRSAFSERDAAAVAAPTDRDAARVTKLECLIGCPLRVAGHQNELDTVDGNTVSLEQRVQER